MSVCPSVRSFGTQLTQQSLHGVKQDLLNMKAMSLRMIEFDLQAYKTHYSLTGVHKR